MIKQYNLYILFIVAIAMAGCEAQGDYPGMEFSPQMYHAVPYEPLTQITDRDAGTWVSSLDDEVGEFYNSNPYNPYAMNLRVPPANTVRRNSGTNLASGSVVRGNDDVFLPYRIPADSLEYAARVLTNPLDSTDAVMAEGQALYMQFCYPCHGGSGQGDGPVGVVYLGVPVFNTGRYRTLTEGHIFHVITYGQGRMNPHGTQIDIEDRWKIVEYVQSLQNQ